MFSGKIKLDFPIFEKNPSLVYLNSAATSLKPKVVVDEIKRYYSEVSANTGRGSHRLSTDATIVVEETREKVARLIGAKPNEVAFTKNTTESINAVAVLLERAGLIKKEDEIVVSFAEHHANILPWMELCKRVGAKLKVVNLKRDFTFDLDDLRSKISRKTRVVAVAGITNTTGTIFPLSEISKLSHDFGSFFVVDGAQLVPHMRVNVNKINCDFLAFSSHKMFGPTGLGVLFVKGSLVERLSPFIFGGGIIKRVSFEGVDYVDGVEKFEAGTLQIGEIYGFKAALGYLSKIGVENVEAHDKALLDFAISKLSEIVGLKIYGPLDSRFQSGIVLFEVKGLDSGDLAIALAEFRDIAVRSGFMCAEPVVRSINPNGLCRASFYVYNGKDDVNVLCDAVSELVKGLK